MNVNASPRIQAYFEYLNLKNDNLFSLFFRVSINMLQFMRQRERWRERERESDSEREREREIDGNVESEKRGRKRKKTILFITSAVIIL